MTSKPTMTTKLEQMQERARDLVIRIASRELYDADSDHTNIAYYEEQVCNGLDDLITEVWNEATEHQGKRAVTLYQQALGDTELPEDIWKKIAKVNQLILDK